MNIYLAVVDLSAGIGFAPSVLWRNGALKICLPGVRLSRNSLNVCPAIRKRSTYTHVWMFPLSLPHRAKVSKAIEEKQKEEAAIGDEVCMLRKIAGDEVCMLRKTAYPPIPTRSCLILRITLLKHFLAYFCSHALLHHSQTIRLHRKACLLLVLI